MQCKKCDHEFNPYMFAYRQIRRCPKCGQMYDMKFPIGTGLIPVIIALIICVYLTISINFTVIVGVSIFILVYYVLDISLKVGMIYAGKYELEEMIK